MEHLGIVKFDHIWPLVLEILSHLNVANQVSVDISMVMFSIVESVPCWFTGPRDPRGPTGPRSRDGGSTGQAGFKQGNDGKSRFFKNIITQKTKIGILIHDGYHPRFFFAISCYLR